MTVTALQFRMGAGFAGAPNRSHPVSIASYQNDATIPVVHFGDAVAVNTGKNGVRAIQSGDTTAAAFFGVAVRPFPFQQGQASSDFAPASIGSGNLLTGMAVDVLKSGFIMVLVNSGTPGLGDPVYVWSAATAAPHVQGQFEGTNPGGSGFQVTGGYFNGAPDSNGIAEIAINP